MDFRVWNFRFFCVGVCAKHFGGYKTNYFCLDVFCGRGGGAPLALCWLTMVFLNSLLSDTLKKNVMTASGNVPSTCSGSWSSNVVMIVVPRESSSFSVEIAAAVVVGTPIYPYI